MKTRTNRVTLVAVHTHTHTHTHTHKYFRKNKRNITKEKHKAI